jgi:hypothetical protein
LPGDTQVDTVLSEGVVCGKITSLTPSVPLSSRAREGEARFSPLSILNGEGPGVRPMGRPIWMGYGYTVSVETTLALFVLKEAGEL